MTQFGTVYVITNTVNGKRYVGQTIRSFDERWRNHITAAYNPELEIYENKFYRAIRKYGIDHFSMMKAKVPIDELDKWESYLIGYFDSYRNGYNLTLGGQGVSLVTDEDSINMRKLWDAHWTISEIATQSNHTWNTVRAALARTGLSDEQLGARGHSWEPHSVVQIDLVSRAILNTFSSVSEAARSVNLLAETNISAVCCNRKKSSAGFYWRYLEDVSENDFSSGSYSGHLPEMYDSGITRKYDYDYVVKMWEIHGFISTTAEAIGCNADVVEAALDEAGITREKRELQFVHPVCKIVAQLDLTTGKELRRFSSASAASRHMGLGNGTISAAITKRDGRCVGYLWKYI